MAFITVAGENQIATKQGAELPLNMANFVLANIAGLGTEPVDRIEAMPIAGDIVATLPITKSGYVNTNQVVYSLVMDSSQGDFDFNWIGLVDDEGVLIAATYVPTISKIANNGALQGNNLTRNFLIAYTGIQATTAIAVPAATWQIDFNARLIGIDERERLSNLDIYGHEGFFGNGYQVVQQGATTTYDILPGVGYVGGIRIESLATQTVVVATPPAAVWLDVSLEGDISNVDAVVAIIADGAAHVDYVDGNGFNHYVTKIADIAANGDATETRVSGEALYDHLTDPDPHPQYLTPAEGDAAYDQIGGLATHVAAADPHPNYLLESNVVSQAAAEAGTATIPRSWTAQRVKQAIQALVQSASETVAGLVERATQAETDALTDDTRYVSPLKMGFGFSILLATTGYITFPAWLGGLIIQWGNVTVTSSGSGFTGTTAIFPLAFPTSIYSLAISHHQLTDNAISGSVVSFVDSYSLTQVILGLDEYGASVKNYPVFYIALGS